MIWKCTDYFNMENLKVCKDWKDNFDEILYAGKRHRDVAVSLKESCDSQKKKLKEYRESTKRLYNDVESLEDDIREKENCVQKVSKTKMISRLNWKVWNCKYLNLGRKIKNLKNK